MSSGRRVDLSHVRSCAFVRERSPTFGLYDPSHAVGSSYRIGRTVDAGEGRFAHLGRAVVLPDGSTECQRIVQTG